MSDDRPTIFVVDDDRAIRQSLGWLIESIGIRVECFESVEEFLDADVTDRPGCLVLDIRMPGKTGMELLEDLAARDALMPVIIITGHGEVPLVVRAFKHGAIDFVEKPFHAQDLIDQIQHAIRLDASRRKRCNSQRSMEERLKHLTLRQREVMALLVKGKINKQIAAALCITTKTVETHRANLMRKIHTDSVAELVHIALSVDMDRDHTMSDTERYKQGQ